jgi:hypothetical protein
MTDPYDIFVIGGGINGCGIARDAPGGACRSAWPNRATLRARPPRPRRSCFTAGLRYLEYFEFRLVREALIERETLLRPCRISAGRCASSCPVARHALRQRYADLAAAVIRHAVDEGAAARVADPAGPVPLRPHGRAEDPARHENASCRSMERPRARRSRTGSNGLRVFRLLGGGFAARRAERPRRGGARARIMVRTRGRQRRAGRGPLARHGRARR